MSPDFKRIRTGPSHPDVAVLYDELADRWVEASAALSRRSSPADESVLAERIADTFRAMLALLDRDNEP